MEEQNKKDTLRVGGSKDALGAAAVYRRASTAGPMASSSTGQVKIVGNVSSFNRKQGTAGNKQVQLGQANAKTEEISIDGHITITKTTDFKSEILCIKYTQECELLAAGLSTGEVKLLKPNTGQCVITLHDKSARSGPVTGIKHRPVHKAMPNTNTITCTYTNGNVKSWHCHSGECIYTINENRQALGISYHHRLPKFVTVGDDAKIFLYDEEAKVQERVFSKTEGKKLDGHTSRVFSACFNPKLPHEFISGGWDDCVHFWDLRQQNATRHFFGAHICGDGLDINNTGTEILTCSWQKKDPLQLWDYGTGKLISNIEPDIINCVLYSGKWINKECFATGGSEPNVLRIVDQRTMSTFVSITGLPGGVYSLDVGPIKQVKSKKGVPPKPVDMLPRMAFCADRKLFEIESV